MIASRWMISSPARWRRPLARTLLAGCLLAAAPSLGGAYPEVVATRGLPSSISAGYGAAVPLGNPSVAGPYAIPTGWGFEIRDAAIGGDPPIGSFRTSGVVSALAADGATLYLFAGSRGIVAVDITDTADPIAIGSRGDLGDVTLGAASPNGYGLVAAAGSDLHFLARAAPGDMSLVATLHFTDGRIFSGAAARADSFLVVSARTSPIPRLFLTLYRLQAGSALPESLREIQVPNQTPTGLAWRGDLAFLAAGNLGVLVANIRTGALPDTAGLGAFVHAVDANDSLVVAMAEAGTFARLRRTGTEGERLVNPTLESLPLEPVQVALSGSRVVISAQDVAVAQEPDEVGQSVILLRDLDVTIAGPGIGGTGRTRRVAWNDGYAYVADYTGGLRIYRADGSDTSLVGAIGLGPNPRVVDIALDPPRNRAYLASGSQGLQIVDVLNPAAPALLATLPLAGLASAVAVIDSSLVVVGRRGTVGAGITFVDTSIPTAPTPRGQLDSGFVPDPRAIAVRDTIAYVADGSVGLLSIGFGNPDAPGLVGSFSGSAARDLDLSGNILLVATRSAGLQIVDVFQPALPALRATVAAPSLFGVARSANAAILLAGNEGALVVDIANPSAPVIRGPIGVPGSCRDGFWLGDTLLITSGFALERFRASPTPTSVPTLTIDFDGNLVVPTARIGWSSVSLAGMAGLNLYRDLETTPAGTSEATGTLINPSLLSPTATEAIDGTLAAGASYRYRLEAFFTDGSALKVAEGALSVPSGAAVGRVYPNPFRAASGALVTLPFRIATGTAGATFEMAVYDVAGRLVVQTSLAVPIAGGFGSVSWDGRNAQGRAMPSGIYFLRLRGQGIDEAHQVVLLR